MNVFEDSNYASDPWWVMSTPGFVKTANEDAIGVRSSQNGYRAVIADGHWGDGAAQLAKKYWLEHSTFPNDTGEAIDATHELESLLYDAYGRRQMDESKDFTPETSFIAVEIRDGVMKTVSYGDCRLWIVRHNDLLYEHPTTPTWLGAFSRLGLRKRLPVSKACIFYEQPLEDEDKVVLFTDGVDECVYETPTIGKAELLDLLSSTGPAEALQRVLKAVESHGAEDNATLALYMRHAD